MLYERVEAQQIVSAAPTNVPALKFLDRPARGKSIRVCALGDISLHGRGSRGETLSDCLRPFEEIAPVLRSSDIVFGNLECVLRDGPPLIGQFSSPQATAHALAQSGFTVLNMANNHVYDYGPEGFAATLQAVEKAGMNTLGAGVTTGAARQMVRTDAGGLKIGWLACGRTLLPQSPDGPNFWEYEPESLLAAVRQNRPEVDVLIVSIHAGYECIEFPSPEQKAVAEQCVAEGAALVLMHHSHVLQGVQTTNAGGVLCYSLGNLIFDSSGGYVEIDVAKESRLRTMVFAFDLDCDGVARAVAIPAQLDEQFVVRWAKGQQGHAMLDHLVEISRPLYGDISAEFERQRAERNVGPGFTVLWYHLRRGHLKTVAGYLARVRPKHFVMVLRWAVGLVPGTSRRKNLKDAR